MINDPEKEQSWRELIEAYNDEEMTIKKYCEMHDVKEHQFYYWRDKFNKQPKEEVLSFIEVKPESSQYPIMVNIHIKLSDMKINVPHEFNITHLKKIIKAIKSLD